MKRLMTNDESSQYALVTRGIDQRNLQVWAVVASMTPDYAWDTEFGRVQRILNFEAGCVHYRAFEKYGSGLRGHSHEIRDVVCFPLQVIQDEAEKEMRALFQFTRHPDSLRTFEAIVDGRIRGTSVGFRSLEKVRIGDGEIGPHGIVGPARFIRRWVLREVSFCPYGCAADKRCGVTGFRDELMAAKAQDETLRLKDFAERLGVPEFEAKRIIIESKDYVRTLEQLIEASERKF